ncbi:ABC transporter substrate-binding protein [Natrarchaeobius halalkaliphilus]|uniref:ABC transporter substrate-binding protein n=1 Tax=Natrarchaeobius halalkaliphilus TaxID=1679091 RepID=A0A3N6LLY4_9EURY|nr:ABC transporter substrate-binding protein [Natrarchaeobius halalkaliphilus]RQG90063.1 ABC transporter substrate-binding protein [Natrarchaeobius halalkaliphilus]
MKSENTVTELNRRQALTLLGGAGSAAMLAGCQDVGDDGDDDSSTLHVQLGGSLDSLDPQLAGLRNTQVVVNRVVEKLFEPDIEMEMEPVLAEGYELTDDGGSVIIQLRDGVMFHPPYEREMVAEDVVYNFDRVSDPDTGSPRQDNFDNLEDWYAEGDYELRIDFEEPEAALEATLANTGMHVLSPDALEEEGDASSHPVGTGPFVFEEWVTRDHIHLVAHDDYRVDGVPGVEEVYFRPIEEPATAITEIQEGEIEMLHDVPLDNAGQLEDDDDIQVQFVEAPDLRFRMMVNASDNEIDGRAPGAPTQSQNIRQAIAEAINQPDFVEIAAGGHADVGQTVYPEDNVWGVDYQPFSVEADPDRAQELIEESDFDAPVELTMISASDEDDLRTLGQLAQDQLNDAGFEVNLEEMEVASWVERLNAFEWDITPNHGSHSPDPALKRFERMFWTDEENVPYYESPDSNADRVFEIFEEDSSELSQDERYELYAEFQRLLCDDAVYLICCHPQNAHALRTYVEDFEIHPMDMYFPIHNARLEQ